MFLIKGTRKARIKVYQHHNRQCEECKDFDFTIGIYQDYFHIFFIPVAATGTKSTTIYCSNCGSRLRSDTLSKEYESQTSVPLYLYSGILLVGIFVLSLLIAVGWGAYERSRYISNPKVGDVYLMKQAQGQIDGHRFIRLSRISGDSVIGMDNNVLYLFPTSSFSVDDYFNTDRQVVFSKAQLKELYKEDSIENVFRDYGNSSWFNRIK